MKKVFLLLFIVLWVCSWADGRMIDSFEYGSETVIDTVWIPSDTTNFNGSYTFIPFGDETGGDTQVSIGDSGGNEYRTAFKITTTYEVQVESLEVYFSSVVGFPSGDLTFRIETDSTGVPSGTLAHASATGVDTTPGASQWNVIDYTDFTLPAGTYWLVGSLPNQSKNYRYGWYCDTTGPVNDIFAQSVNGGAWATYDTVRSFYYRLKGFPTAQAGDRVLCAKALITNSLNDTLTYNLPTGKYHGFYNGSNNGVTPYQIGAMTSTNMIDWTKYASNPVLTGSVAWEANGVHYPWVVYYNNLMYVYYNGWVTGSYRKTGVALTSNGFTLSKYANNPIIEVGAGGSWDDARAYLPVVGRYPNEPTASKRWKMWYTGDDGTPFYQIGYAYSADGLTWTKYASNPVVTKGTSGQWDDTHVVISGLYDESGTYYIFYTGDNGSDIWEGGFVSCTDPEGTYTRATNNPVLERRSSATGTLTADLLSGNTTVTVADTSVFEVNEPVVVDDNDSGYQQTYVASITDGTHLEIRTAAAANYTTAQSALIRSVYYNKVDVRSVVRWTDGTYKISIIGWGALTGQLMEVEGWATASALDSKYAYDFTKDLSFDLGSGGWDDDSAENETRLYNQDLTLDLSGYNNLTFFVHASRTGSNFKIGIHDTGGTTTEHTVAVSAANTWELETVDLSAVADENKNLIDWIKFTITNADAANTIYIDKFEAGGRAGKTPTPIVF